MFRLAHELKRPLHEVMSWSGPMTYRQFLAWQEWLKMEWDRPSRSDWYAMQIAAEIQRHSYRSGGVDPRQVKEANMKLTFKPNPNIKVDDLTDEQFKEWEMNISKQAALARRGKLVQEAPIPEEIEGELIEEQPDWTWQGDDREIP